MIVILVTSAAMRMQAITKQVNQNIRVKYDNPSPRIVNCIVPERRIEICFLTEEYPLQKRCLIDNVICKCCFLISGKYI